MNLQGSLPTFQFLVRWVSDVLLPGWIPNHRVRLGLSQSSELTVPKMVRKQWICAWSEPWGAQPVGDTAISYQLFSQDQLLQNQPESIQEDTPGYTSTYTESSWPPEVKHSYLALEDPSAAQCCLAPLPVFPVLVAPVVPLCVFQQSFNRAAFKQLKFFRIFLWGFWDTFALPTIHVAGPRCTVSACTEVHVRVSQALPAEQLSDLGTLGSDNPKWLFLRTTVLGLVFFLLALCGLIQHTTYCNTSLLLLWPYLLPTLFIRWTFNILHQKANTDSASRKNPAWIHVKNEKCHFCNWCWNITGHFSKTFWKEHICRTDFKCGLKTQTLYHKNSLLPLCPLRFAK